MGKIRMVVAVLLLLAAAAYAEEMEPAEPAMEETTSADPGADEPSAQGFVNPQLVTLIDYTPRPVQPGQWADIVVQVERNPLRAQAQGSEGAWIEVLDEYPFTVEKTLDYERAKDIGTLAFGQKLQFRIRVDENAREGLTSLRIRHGDSTRNRDAFTVYNFTLNVQALDANVAVTGVRQEPEVLAPGEKGKVYLTISSHDSRPLRNVDVILDLTQSFDVNDNMNNIIASQAMMNSMVQAANLRMANGQSPFMNAQAAPALPEEDDGMEGSKKAFVAFAPQGTATRQRFGTLQPGQSSEIAFDIVALPDAEPGVYAVPLIINYNDQRNNPYNIKTEIGLSVDAPPDLYVTIEKSMLRSTFFAGDVTIAVANRGPSTLKYVVLSMGDSADYQVITAPQSTYLGSIMPGEKMMAMFKILPTEKDIAFPVRIEYKDSFNREHTVEAVLPLEVINDMPYRDTPWESMVAWLVLGVVVAVLVGWYVKGARATKKRGGER